MSSERMTSSMRIFVSHSSTLLFRWSCRWLTLTLVLLLSEQTHANRVTGGDQVVLQGGSATFPCQLAATTDTITQITWDRMTKENPNGKGFYVIQANNGGYNYKILDNRFTFIGNLKGHNGSLTIANATLMDEGNYTCIFTLYPSGSFQTQMSLEVKVPPVTLVKDDFPVLSEDEALLATCLAFGSKPAAQVEWDTGNPPVRLRATTNSTLHDNGTTTTVCYLFGTPIIEINNHTVQCVITTSALSEKKTIPFSLNVYFSPRYVSITEVSENSFSCKTNANPSANITWTRLGQPLPEVGVRVKNNILQFTTMGPAINGYYRCEASNVHGRELADLLMHVVLERYVSCWILFSILLILNVLVVVLCFKYPKVRQRFADILQGQRDTTTSRRTAQEDEVESL
uniref:Nectin-4-like n=1 Tax=Cynoglossus semilaevis TaxID=244447 RepID=A0A3P8VZW5_CYNSE